MWTHTVTVFALSAGMLLYTAQFALVGMTLFFVLSGFVIHYNYGEEVAGLRFGQLRRFGVARLARLYPLYLLALCFYFFVAGTRHPFDLHTFAGAWPFYLTLTQSWFPIHAGDGYLAVLYLSGAWSISAEVLLYLFYLTVAWAICSLRTSRAAAAALVLLGVGATLVYGGHAMGFWLTGVEPEWGFYLSPYCRIAEFLLGALTAACYRQSSRQRPQPEFGVGGAALLLGGAAWLVIVYALAYNQRFGTAFRAFQTSWGFAPGIAALLYFFARYRTRLSHLVENRLVLGLGDASYSLYLLAPFVFGISRRAGLGDAGWLVTVRALAAWVLAALVAVVCYRYYEMPARRMVRRVFAGGPPQPMEAARLGRIA
jgi:peptidoglycan/LPS O-acetylase OafA/YrhL